MAISAKRNIPDLPPFKLITVRHHYTYLWPYTARVRYGRITRVRAKQSAGKILGGGPTGLVVWRDEFIAKYPELRGYNVYREEVESGGAATAVRYELVFKPRQGEAEINSFQTQQYYQAGATYTLDQLQQGSPILGALGQTFALNYQGDKLLSLAYYSLLTGSLAYQDFLFFQADTRLPYPDALTERDINNLLSDVSDVAIAQFMSALSERSARRFNRKSRLYALQIPLPHNLMAQLVEGRRTIYTNQDDLDQVITRDVHDLTWRSREQAALLARFSDSQDDQALLLFNGSTGQTFGFNLVNSHDFTLRELCEFLTNSARPERPAPQLPEPSEYELALKNTKELEQKTGYVDLSKPDRIARTRALNQAISLIGALSPTGSSAVALRHLTSLNHSDPTARRHALLGANRPGTALITPEESPLPAPGGLMPKPPLVRPLPESQQTASQQTATQQAATSLFDEPQSARPAARFTAKSSENAPVVLVGVAPHDFIAQLRHYNQLSQPVLFDVPLSHHVGRYLKKRVLAQLLELGHYDYEHQRFSLTLRLPHRFPEYDLSAKYDVFSKDPLVQRAIIKPKQLSYELVVHVVFDLEPLLAASAHTKQQRKEQEEAAAEAEEGFEDTVFEQETKQGTVRLSARQAKKLSAIDLETETLLDELPQASFWQGQDSIKTHTYPPLRELDQDDLDLIDDVGEALARLSEESSDATRTSSLSTSVVNAWRDGFADLSPEPAPEQPADQPTAPESSAKLHPTGTRFHRPTGVTPLEGQSVPQPPAPETPSVTPSVPRAPEPDFFEREEARLNAVGTHDNAAANKASDAERLALLMRSFQGQATTESPESPEPPQRHLSDWLPLRETQPTATEVTIEQLGEEPIAPSPAPEPTKPEAEPTAPAAFTDSEEEEREAEALAAAMLDAADQAAHGSSEPSETASTDQAPATSELTQTDDHNAEPEAEDDWWDAEERHRTRRHLRAESFFDLEDEEPPVEPKSAAPTKPSAEAPQVTRPAQPKEDLDLWADEERPHLQADSFFDLEDEAAPVKPEPTAPATEPNKPNAAPAQSADTTQPVPNLWGAEESSQRTEDSFFDLEDEGGKAAGSLDELLKARRQAKRQQHIFDLEEEEHEEVRAPQAVTEDKEAKVLDQWPQRLQVDLEPQTFDVAKTEVSGASFEVASDQLTDSDAPLIRAKPKALGALATLAAAAQERRTQRADRVLSEGQKRRLTRDLKELIALDLTESLGCLKIMVSNQVTDVNEAYRTVQSLDVAKHYLDLMCYDVYKVERARLNPLAMTLKPRLLQLLRGKNFVLFYALSLHLMLKHLLECKDASAGGRALRQRMGIYEVSDLLKTLNRISAARRDEGLFYPDLKMQYRSLFEFAGVAPPSFEGYDESVSEHFVHLRRSNTGR